MYLSHNYTNQGQVKTIMQSFRLWNFPSRYVKVHLSFIYTYKCFQTCEFDWNLKTYQKDINVQSNSI